MHGRLAPTGVDQRIAATLDFGGCLASQFICGFDTASDNAFHIMGERGSITLPRNFWQATEAQRFDGREQVETVQAPFHINTAVVAVRL